MCGLAPPTPIWLPKPLTFSAPARQLTRHCYKIVRSFFQFLFLIVSRLGGKQLPDHRPSVKTPCSLLWTSTGHACLLGRLGGGGVQGGDRGGGAPDGQPWSRACHRHGPMHRRGGGWGEWGTSCWKGGGGSSSCCSLLLVPGEARRLPDWLLPYLLYEHEGEMARRGRLQLQGNPLS